MPQETTNDPPSVNATPEPPPPRRADPVAMPGGRGEVTAWTGGRVVSVVIGAVLILASAGLLAGGSALLWFNLSQREGTYVMGPRAQVSTTGYAIASGNIELRGAGFPWVVDNLIGTARLEAAPAASDTALFVGVARTADANQYLRGVAYREVRAFITPWASLAYGSDYVGTAPATAPDETDIWVAQSSGAGTQTLDWRPSDGNWTFVVMRADGGPLIDATVRLGATGAGMPWVVVGLLAGGGVLLLGGGLLIVSAVRRASRSRSASAGALR